MSAPYQPSRSIIARLHRQAVQAFAPLPIAYERHRGAVCFSFDDVPRSAIVHAAPMLEAHGVRGVFYLCAGFTGATTHLGEMHTRADIDALLRAGHEIACHTASHHDLAAMPVAAAIAETDANAKAMSALGAPAMAHFAYPYGETQFALKRAFGDRFITARGVNGGVNVGRIDRMQLRAQRLYGEASLNACQAVMRSAKDHTGLAILFTHDVQDTPTPYGCTPDLLQRAIAYARTLDLDIITLSTAFPTMPERA
jgi:peptidoglycan/xylan/chitin deacetylase (PgdA/CDA1 family)